MGAQKVGGGAVAFGAHFVDEVGSGAFIGVADAARSTTAAA
ncbi:hypothetical protein [Nocardia aurantiaca]|nr:hypothetical protein [Nocardia aurantiaca]